MESKPQGEPMGKWVEEAGKSKWLAVMAGIRVRDLPARPEREQTSSMVSNHGKHLCEVIFVARVDGGIHVADGQKNDAELWGSVNWDQANQIVHRLQMRIVKAVKAGNRQLVRSLQRLLARSHAAKLLAVNKVTTNRGKRTPGVDNVVLDTPAKKWRASQRLNQPGYTSKPLKRVYIPKKNGKKRPLGIPTMMDRAEQSLEQFGLDPVSEATADPHSYGFRKKRSCHDAISACYNALRLKASAKWILEADIKGCFDHIDHEWMVSNVPTRKSKLLRWLKSGYMERSVFNPTEEGTPQGGIISPTLANVALDGMQALLADNFGRKDKIHFIRYADDFIITGCSQEILRDRVQPLIEEFLRARGLSLSAEKTRISHIAKGFDFLGFNLRKYANKLLIKPSKSSISRFKEGIRTLVRMNKNITTDELILKLNPVLRGWANYYRHVVSKKIFCGLDHEIWKITWRWAKRRHPNKSLGWIKSKYYQCKGSRTWVFCEQGSQIMLLKLGDIPIIRHLKIKSVANPYDPKWLDYFMKREQRLLPGVSQRPFRCLSLVR